MSKSVVIVGDTRRPHQAILDNGARLAAALTAAGVGVGDAIAVLARNDFVMIEANLAVRLLDAYVVPINWQWHADEIRYVLENSETKVLIGHSDLLAAIEFAVPSGITIVTLDPPAHGGTAAPITRAFVHYPDWLASFPPHQASGTGRGSSMIYTSGTTGKPKAVRRMAANAQESEQRRRLLALVYDAAPENCALVTGPMYHLFSQATALSNFGAGASVVIMPKFDAEEVLRLIMRHQITHTSFVPTMMVRLMRLPEDVKARYDISSLRHVTQSGAPCAQAIKRAMLDWFGPIIHETYGSTETGIITQIRGEAWLTRPTSVGKPVLTGEVRIYSDDGTIAPANETGEIFLRMHGTPDFTYQGDPTARAQIERDGLIGVGDLGYLDDDGFLHICDRRADMLICGGVNIYPAEIEGALLAHPDIKDAAVFGIPDPEYGEIAVAHVCTTGGLNAERIKSFLQERIARYKCPRLIILEDAIPRAENGKILKRVLKDRYQKAVA